MTPAAPPDKIIATRGNLKQCQWYNLQGYLMRAFHVENSRGKHLAIGAIPSPTSPGFCIMHAKRYAHDATLTRAIEQLTGIAPRPTPARPPKPPETIWEKLKHR